MQGSHSFTIEAWIMVETFNKGQQLDNAIIGIDDHGVGAFHLVIRKRRIYGSFYGPPTFHSDKILENNRFYHIAVVFDHISINEPFSLYIDGVRENIIHETVGKATPRLCHLNLARYAGGRHLNGVICEFRIWNKVLTEDQISKNKYKKN